MSGMCWPLADKMSLVPSCLCGLLALNVEGSMRLLPLYVPSNCANSPGQFLAACEFHQLINIHRMLS